MERVSDLFENRCRGDVVSPKVFMTDDDSSYYNAWTAVMGEPQKRLICTWHVGQSWKRKLGKLGFTALDQKDLLSKLISIKSALTQKAYNRRKNSLIKALTEEDEESLVEMKQRRQAVLKYLPTYYFTQERELIWANCHRCGLGLTIDNYAESFFNVLKNTYSIKNNHLLHALVHVLCNKAYDDSKKYLEKCRDGRICEEKIIKEFHAVGIAIKTYKKIDADMIM